MKKLFTLFFVILAIAAWSQKRTAQQAWIDQDGHMQVRDVLISEADYLEMEMQKSEYEQLANWPKRIAAHPNFKNFRGVTLADITGDGMDEILVASFGRLYAYKGNGDLLWSLQLTGTAIYPPSVADVTGNGELELVQLTGGVPNNGRAYVIDKDGNVLPGWPVSIGNQWLLSAPALADLDGNGQMEIVFGVRTVNEIHVLKADGSNFNENWPVELASIPAFTPSLGDINNDGEMNIIAGASNGTLYAFTLNAGLLPGFPVAAANTSFSYQSPLLADLDGDSLLSIVGATHGDAPQYYVRKSDGTYREGWPVAVPGGGWTYSPPTLADITGDSIFEIFVSKPIGDAVQPMLFGYNEAGEMLPGFPISKSGGLESFISVADIDGDGQHDLIFGSNMMVDGKGFIHAWKTDGAGQLPGFPLRPDGFTFMNGANLGDVTGDGLLNLVALTYEQTFSASDSALINVWNLGITVEEADVLFGTYKGNNTRSGLMTMSVEEPEPVFASFRFSNASFNSRDEHVKLWYNDSVLIDNAFFRYASDLLQIKVNEPFELSISFGEGEDLVIVYTETLEMEEDDLWMVFFAGDNPEGPAKDGDFPAGFYIYEDFKLHADDPESYDMLFFDAFNHPDFSANYVLHYSEGSIELGNFQGEYRGYYTTSVGGIQVDILTEEGQWALANEFQFFTGFEPGDALTFVIANEISIYPIVFLLPKSGGEFIEPGLVINNVEENDLAASELHIFPNPVMDHFEVSFKAHKPGNLNFELYDALGRKVVVQEHQVIQTGLNLLKISRPDLLGSGIYFLKLHLGDRVYTGKVMLK